MLFLGDASFFQLSGQPKAAELYSYEFIFKGIVHRKK